jgi:hypothetical protein
VWGVKGIGKCVEYECNSTCEDAIDSWNVRGNLKTNGFPPTGR